MVDFREKFVVLVVFGILLVVLNYIWARGRTLPPPAAEAGIGPFTAEYEQLRGKFCEYLLSQLDEDDKSLNWSDGKSYTTLEAEVEVDRHGAKRPRVERDLIAAIRRDQTY